MRHHAALVSKLVGCVACLLFWSACGGEADGGGGGGGGGGGVDARGAGASDAPAGGGGGASDAGAPDASGGGGAGPLGASCVGEGQGSCPAGYACLNLVGGAGSWCSRTCNGAQDLTCNDGFAGPGYGSCLLTVTPAGGGAPQLYCTIICSDAAGAPTLCPAGEDCTGTCPAPLACAGQILDQNDAVVGATCR